MRVIKHKSKYLVLSAFLLIAIVFSCSTEKNAFLNKKYHYVTVRYNGYFNGNEAYKLAKKNIAENHNDDFDEVIDVFKYGSESENKGEFPNLDRALTKGAKMIDRHSMKFKVKTQEVEFNQMIDDCYLLIGKARFLKYDLEEAKATFLYVKNTYEKGNERYKATLWLIMTYIYQENFVDAETLIKAVKEDEKFPDKYKDELALIEAIGFKRSGQIEKAIPALEEAVSVTKKRKLKRRIQFVLAQMYQGKGDMKKASGLYKVVAKKATNYDLQFNAKIKLAVTYDGDAKEVISLLEKMLKDGKNKEYFDQIYFALAQVYEKQGNDEMTIKCYELSAKTSVNNKKQKGKAFLALGDYYFGQPDYIKASNYYDSTLIMITAKFPNYEEIAAKKESLKDLVKHLKIVKEQDSLLKVANMTDEERETFVEGKIAEAKEKAEDLLAQQEADREKALVQAQLQGGNGETWVFNNPTLLASGLAEFKGLWGDRPLEDNWRRSDKTSLAFEQVAQENEEGIEEDLPIDQTAEFYLKDLPLEPAQQELSNQKIMNSYYQLGVIYRDNFSDLPNSIYYFEKLNKRYPKNTKEAVTWYQLYRNFDKVNDSVKREDVKQKVIKNYPESEYAQLLLNPNMLAEQEQKQASHVKVYESIFDLYKAENYNEVVTQVDAYKPNLNGGEIEGKFDLIKAFAIGNLNGKEALEKELRIVYSNNMGTQVANEVDVILGRFKAEKEKEAMAKREADAKAKEFTVTHGEPQYFMFIYSNETNKSAELVNKVSDFNKKYFSTISLKVKSIAWSDKEDVIVVKPFKTNKESGDYYGTIQQEFLKKNPDLGDLHFMISTSNYKKLFQYKQVLRYIDFYKKNFGPRG